MQINNNSSSQNFGMALKISKGARKALQNASLTEISNLQKAGEELKDTKFYHVAVDENLKCTLKADKDAYFDRFETPEFITRYGTTRNSQGLTEQARNILLISKKNAYNSSDLCGVARYEKDGEPVFNVWGNGYVLNNLDSIEQLAKATKILDGVAIDKYAEATQNIAKATIENQNKNKVIEHLLDSFGE